ncbi:MAG: hypothetical protein CMM00_00340 [Rhodopirellula sp.]|nr:hypothetical protein [Rhodopirellula sp.]
MRSPKVRLRTNCARFTTDRGALATTLRNARSETVELNGPALMPGGTKEHDSRPLGLSVREFMVNG